MDAVNLSFIDDPRSFCRESPQKSIPNNYNLDFIYKNCHIRLWSPQKKELKAIRINKSLNSFDKPTQLFH